MSGSGNSIDGLPDKAWDLLRTLFNAGYIMGYGNGWYDHEHGESNDASPHDAFELQRDESEHGIEWAERLHDLLGTVREPPTVTGPLDFKVVAWTLRRNFNGTCLDVDGCFTERGASTRYFVTQAEANEAHERHRQDVGCYVVKFAVSPKLFPPSALLRSLRSAALEMDRNVYDVLCDLALEREVGRAPGGAK